MEEQSLARLLEVAAARERLASETPMAIREARRAAGLTQAEVASALGTTSQYVSRIETGRDGASPQTMRRLADVLAEHASRREAR